MSSSLTLSTSSSHTVSYSYLESHRQQISEAMDEANTRLIATIKTIVEDYLIQGQAFDHKQWKDFFGVKVDEVPLPINFYDFWYSKDVDSPDLNCDTHFPPLLLPANVTFENAEGNLTKPFNLKILESLVNRPLKGFPAQFDHSTQVITTLAEKGITKSCWIVVRKELFGRGLAPNQLVQYMKNINEQYKTNYELLPTVLQLSTMSLVHYVFTKQIFLGNLEGLEKQWTQSYCEETDGDNPKHIVVGAHSHTKIDGERSWGGLNITNAPTSATKKPGVAGVYTLISKNK